MQGLRSQNYGNTGPYRSGVVFLHPTRPQYHRTIIICQVELPQNKCSIQTPWYLKWTTFIEDTGVRGGGFEVMCPLSFLLSQFGITGIIYYSPGACMNLNDCSTTILNSSYISW